MKVLIDIPKGLSLDVQPGQETELLAKVLVTKDGKLQLESLDGKDISSGAVTDEDEAEEGSSQDGAPDGDQPSGDEEDPEATQGGDPSQGGAAPGGAPDPSQGGGDTSQAGPSTGSPNLDSLLSQLGSSGSKSKPAAKKHVVVTAQSPEEYFKKRAKAREIEAKSKK